MNEPMTSFPLLSLLIFGPALVAAGLFLFRMEQARYLALTAALAELLLSLVLLSGFDAGHSGMQWLERLAWIPSLNIHYQVGVDGISVLFFPLTALLFLGVVATSWNSVHTMPRLYYALLLLLETATLGVFSALDLILFFLFWELTLIPLYFLISLWGHGPNRRYAAIKYTLLMLAGGVPLLFAFVLLAFDHAQAVGAALPGGLVFDYLSLTATPPSAEMEWIIFLLLLLGFGVKTPVFPFHTWLPVVATEGPVVVAALLTGLKLGAYGLIRFALPLAPNAAVEYHWLLAGLGTLGLVYGAVAALAQTNLRRMLAYGSISHVGLVLLGIASFSQAGLQGAVFQLLNFTLVAGGLYLLVGFLHQRTGNSDVVGLGGAAGSMPLLASAFFLLGMAAIGVPGTNGFPAEFLILMSALESHTGAGLAALGVAVIGAAYTLSLYRQTFFGPTSNPAVAETVDLRPRELAITLMVVGLILLFGIFPSLILDTTHSAIEALLLVVSSR